MIFAKSEILVKVKDVDSVLVFLLVPSHEHWEAIPVLDQLALWETVTFLVEKVDLVLTWNLVC